MDFPLPRRCPFDPPAEYRTATEERPLTQVTLPTGGTAWLATRYADVRMLLAHPDISSDARHPNFPALGVGEREAAAAHRPFIRMDPPDHTSVRRMLQGTFTVKRAQEMRPAIQQIVDEAVTDLLASTPPVDLVAVYANRVATETICHLLGIVTPDDLAFFRKITAVTGARASTAEQIGEALGQLFALLNRVVDDKISDPGEDLISRLATGPLAEGRITRTDLLSQLGITLNAGHETTRSMISLSVLALLHHPGQLDLLRADPALLPGAVDELLRYLSVADTIPLRVALADIPVGSQVIRAGEAVIASLGSANRDPAAFNEPDTLDIRRADNRHLALGHGVHQCIGGHLGRMELELALSALIERVPALRLAGDIGDLPLRQANSIFGVESMPVGWGPR
ncbi:MAG TPA: cytochrome P450 [Streptosporangiaceae bacterium]|jgi:cytochrome P450|nr:cytochrome P450 [Streptosporangiaceae bacterium]